MRVVLAVDDDPVLRTMLQRAILTDDRFAVITADTGEEAVSVVESGGADAMVLDLLMPGMDGLAVLKQVGHLVPTIILTALADEVWTIDRCMKAGARAIVAKPFDPDELLQAVLDILPPEPPPAET